NATEEDRLAITLPDGEAFAFYDIPWQTTTEYVTAALSDPVADVILSLCTIDACIRINFDSIGGVQALEPLAAYSLVVTKPGDFAADIVQDADPAPFVGVRPHVIDGSAGIAVGTNLDLVMSGQEIVLEKIFVPVPGRYEMLDPIDEPVLEQLTYIDGEGTTHVLEESLSLPDAPGYTVVLGPSAVDGAAASVLLTAQP
ncbi:MAG: hypothetical protein RIF41_12940, partial [Polyangiaceae bacterium]